MKKLSKNLAMYICMLVAVFCAMTLQAEAANTTTGTFGERDSIVWTYDADTKTLTLTGDGELEEVDWYYEEGLVFICPDVEIIKVKDCKLSSCSYMFGELEYVKSITFENFDTSQTTDMSGMFGWCFSLESLDVSGFDTSQVTDMYGMFEYCESLESVDVSGFDTAKVCDMGFMFRCCESLTGLDMSNFDTTKVNDTSYMLIGCNSLETIKSPKAMGDLSISLPFYFEDSEGNPVDVLTDELCNKTLVKYMASIPITSIQLEMEDHYLLAGQTMQVQVTIKPDNAVMKELLWESSGTRVATVDATGKVTAVAPGTATITATARDGSEVSASCEVTVAQPVTGITLNKTSVELPAGGACKLNAKVAPSSANPSVIWESSDTTVATVDANGNVTAVAPGTATITATAKDGSGVSASCTVTVTTANSGYLGDNDGIYWTYDAATKTLTITGEDSGFKGVHDRAISNSKSPFADICVDVEVIKISNCTPIGDITGVFAYLESLKKVEFEEFDTSQVTNMSYMFNGCSGLTSLDVSGFDTSQVTDMSEMFYGCSGLISLDVSNFDTSNVKFISLMFMDCSGLTSLDVSSFDTSKVYNFMCMFRGCSSLTSLDVSNFDTSNASTLHEMFYGCSSLTSVNVSGLKANNATLHWMFQDCTSLESLDLSNFEVASPSTIYGMFKGCTALKNLNLGGLDLSSGAYCEDILENCNALQVIYTTKGMGAENYIDLPGTFANPELNQTTVLNKNFCNTTLINVNNLVTGVSVAPTSVELKPGDVKQLQATVAPANAAIKDVTWKSSNTAVATVDATGKVTAVAEGTATITATVKDGTGISASCTVTVTEPVPETPESQVRAFVERMYTVALGRAAEAEGLNFYVQRLFAGDSNGACLAESFLCSPEFLNKGHSDAEYVKVLYRTFFDREPAAEEVNYWVNKLASGESKAFVLSGFVNSYEFDNLCAEYGISRGFMREDGKPLNPGIGRFAERLYTVVLERAGEKEGIEYWSLNIANGVCTPKDAAKNFFLSPEYINKNTSDAKYITTLYRTFMDREPEAGGVEYWQNVLNNGATREQILEGFADSAEFKGIMANFGL